MELESRPKNPDRDHDLSTETIKGDPRRIPEQASTKMIIIPNHLMITKMIPQKELLGLLLGDPPVAIAGMHGSGPRGT